jgi:hypothetical protein
LPVCLIKEDAMKTRIWFGAFAASVSLGLSLPSMADGTMIRWDRIDGIVAADLAANLGVPVSVGPFEPSPRWRSVGSGRVVLNLSNGWMSVKYTGFSWANHYSNAPLGSPVPQTGGPLKATVVCNSTERFGTLDWVDTGDILTNGGDGDFQGFVDLPSGCRDNPEDTVVLIRHKNSGTYIGYGADRKIQ